MNFLKGPFIIIGATCLIAGCVVRGFGGTRVLLMLTGRRCAGIFFSVD